MYLAKKYGVKWIPTWNDPYCMSKFPPPYGKGAGHYSGYFYEKLIKDISLLAYKHIFPSERLKNYMLGYMHGMKAENCIIIPHILMEEQMCDRLVLKKDVLTILYSGIITRERVSESFFKGFSAFCEKKSPNVLLTFRGVLDKVSQPLFYHYISKYNLEKYIEVLPPVSFTKSLVETLEYHVSLVLEADCEEGIFLPGKVPNYLQCGAAIFAVSPKNGVLNDLYHNGMVEYFADTSSAIDIENEFIYIYQRFVEVRVYDTQKDISFFASSRISEIMKRILE